MGTTATIWQLVRPVCLTVFHQMVLGCQVYRRLVGDARNAEVRRLVAIRPQPLALRSGPWA